MTRFLGVALLVALLYGGLMATGDNARSAVNHQNLASRMGFYGVLTLGAGVLIISGGIDLSIGSVVGLGAVSFALLMRNGVSPYLAAVIVVGVGTLIGLLHGLLVTQLGLQPFLVTLCGLFAYRGVARQLSDRDVGLGQALAANRSDPGFAAALDNMQFLATGTVSGVPTQLLLLLGVAALVAVLVHGSVYGRYLYAIGSNEQAARYAGIPTARYKVLAYVLCSGLAGLGGVLEMLYVETASPPSAGTLYELYAITGAVLGGCSLRGGEGTVLGILLGTAVLPLLKSLIKFLEIPDAVEFTIIGMALLAGTIVDQLFVRRGRGG